MSSSTMSKRLCSAIPRQTRSLSLYSHQHIVLDSVPPPQPYARPSPVATSCTPTSQSSSQYQTQSSQPLTPSPPLQITLSALPRSAGHSSNSSSQVSLFPSTSFFPSSFPYFTPGGLHAPPAKRSRLTYQLNTGAYGIPKRRAHSIATSVELDLAVQVGEDAYFLRPDAMGVADGVGGWSKASPATANSALFSKSLMHYCSCELSLLASSPPPPPSGTHPEAHAPTVPDVHPIDILQRSYDRCLQKFKKLGLTGGSATALLAILRDEELRIAHLGDCAVCLIRDGGIVYRSEEMQHAFNYPLQLGPASPTLPIHARAISIPVRPDDILILSSDGMTDNLWDEDVLDEITKFTHGISMNMPKKWLPGVLSQALCSRAKSVSERRGRERAGDEVPFARKAREEGITFVGGKCDDISVLVAIISPYADQERTSL